RGPIALPCGRHHKSSLRRAKGRSSRVVSPRPPRYRYRMSRAIRLFPLSLFALLISAAIAHAYSDEAIADAEALLKSTTGRPAAKEASAQDVAVAPHHLLQSGTAPA